MEVFTPASTGAASRSIPATTATPIKAREAEWLPTAEDRAWVKSLMHPVVERAKVASWIAPPAKGINGMPMDFEYVKPPEA